MGPWAGLAVPDVVGVVNMVPSGSDVTPEGGGSAGMVVLAGGMQYTGAAYHRVRGRCGGIVGGFECGPRFDDTVGGACKSMCITIVIVLGYPACMVSLGLLVLILTFPFFNSVSGLLFDLWYPLTNLLFSLILRCGCIMRRFINDWCGGRFSGCGVHDRRRDLVG